MVDYGKPAEDFGLSPLRARIEFLYDPEEYILACEENEEIPTQAGFRDWVSMFAADDLGSDDYELVED